MVTHQHFIYDLVPLGYQPKLSLALDEIVGANGQLNGPLGSLRPWQCETSRFDWFEAKDVKWKQMSEMLTLGEITPFQFSMSRTLNQFHGHLYERSEFAFMAELYEKRFQCLKLVRDFSGATYWYRSPYLIIPVLEDMEGVQNGNRNGFIKKDSPTVEFLQQFKSMTQAYSIFKIETHWTKMKIKTIQQEAESLKAEHDQLELSLVIVKNKHSTAEQVMKLGEGSETGSEKKLSEAVAEIENLKKKVGYLESEYEKNQKLKEIKEKLQQTIDRTKKELKVLDQNLANSERDKNSKSANLKELLGNIDQIDQDIKLRYELTPIWIILILASSSMLSTAITYVVNVKCSFI